MVFNDSSIEAILSIAGYASSFELIPIASALVQKHNDGTEYVTKKSITETSEEMDKEYLARFTSQHPEVFSDFKRDTIEKLSEADGSVLEDIDVCGHLNVCMPHPFLRIFEREVVVNQQACLFGATLIHPTACILTEYRRFYIKTCKMSYLQLQEQANFAAVPHIL